MNKPKSIYTPDDADPFTVCVDGACVNQLFSQRITEGDPLFVGHFDDMAGASEYKYHTQYKYDLDKIADDRRIAYDSSKYPWLVAVFQYHNKANMHSEWDLISMDLPVRWKIYIYIYIKHKAPHQCPLGKEGRQLCYLSLYADVCSILILVL